MEYKINQIDIIEYEEGIKQLVKYAIRKELIPVFGAGFTAGCQSINGIVPNGKRATESMCDMILNSGYFHRYPTYLNLELPVGKNTMSERIICFDYRGRKGRLGIA